jgi:hypothetical protein
MSISPDQYNEMLRRTEINSGRLPKDAPISDDAVGAGKEIEELHRPIIEWLKGKQFPFFYTRPDRPSGAIPGTVDFGILAKGNIILIECKTREGKMRPEQIGWSILAERQSHKVHVIRSMGEFFQLMAPYY